MPNGVCTACGTAELPSVARGIYFRYCDGCSVAFCNACFHTHIRGCHFATCDGCGDWITAAAADDGQYCYCDECGEYRCEDCGVCECDNSAYRVDRVDSPYCYRDSDRVHGWNYRPSPFRPKGNYPAEVLMGVELEVGRNRSDIVPTVAEIDPEENHLYLKTDGSITGLEIVTHPMTLAWARAWRGGTAGTATAGVPGGLTAMLTGLRDAGCYVDEGYGLHVHVSRNAFRSKPREMTYAQAAECGIIPPHYGGVGYANLPYRTKQSPTHQMAWLLFLYRNRDHIDHPDQLARRDCSEWGSFEDTGPGDLKRKAYDRPTPNDSRYVAVNTNNEKTYELRFFASTLDEVQFWAALEFADASVEYTRNMRAKDILRGNALSWSAFTAWVNEHNYPNLSAELARIAPAYIVIAAERRIERERRQRDRAARQDRYHVMRRDEIASGIAANWATACGLGDCQECYGPDTINAAF